MKDIIIRSEKVIAHVNAFGAELKGLCMDGVEYLYDGDPDYYGRTSPTLFPIIGRFLSDTYFDGDKFYRMPLNGIAQNRNFRVLEQGDHFVCFVLKSDERTLKMYPYAFELQVKYTLNENIMQVSYLVKNTGNGELPFCLGCHTAYRWPLFDGESPDDYLLRFEQEEDLESFNPFGWRQPGFVQGKERPLSHDLFANFTRSITGLKSEWVEYANKVNGHAVRIHRDQMPYLAIWSMADENAKVVCVEPCTSVHVGGCTTMFDRNGVLVLKPGEICEKSFSIELR